MADTNILNSIIDINGTNYSVTAVTAEKVENALTIATGKTEPIEFNGSKPTTLELKTVNGESLVGSGNIEITGDGGSSGVANTIKVSTDFGDGAYNATITISQEDPEGGSIGNIWFKY